jgi:hypothetical protein
MGNFKTGDLVWFPIGNQICRGKLIAPAFNDKVFYIKYDTCWYTRKPYELKLLTEGEAMLWKLEH